MIYLISEILLSLALAALLGGALGWLAHRRRSKARLLETRQALAGQTRLLAEARGDVAMLADDFEELRQRSQREIEALRAENRQLPELADNLEKSQLMVRQMIQRHDAEVRELVREREALDEHVALLQGRTEVLERARAELEQAAGVRSAGAAADAEVPGTSAGSEPSAPFAVDDADVDLDHAPADAAGDAPGAAAGGGASQYNASDPGADDTGASRTGDAAAASGAELLDEVVEIDADLAAELRGDTEPAADEGGDERWRDAHPERAPGDRAGDAAADDGRTLDHPAALGGPIDDTAPPASHPAPGVGPEPPPASSDPSDGPAGDGSGAIAALDGSVPIDDRANDDGPVAEASRTPGDGPHDEGSAAEAPPAHAGRAHGEGPAAETALRHVGGAGDDEPAAATEPSSGDGDAASNVPSSLDDAGSEAALAPAAEPPRGGASAPLGGSADDPFGDGSFEDDPFDEDADATLAIDVLSPSELAEDAAPPRDGEPPLFHPVDRQDDLQRIIGIGPVTERALNALGITSYSQLAELESHEIEKIADALQIGPERIERDDWVGSARRQLEEVLEEL